MNPISPKVVAAASGAGLLSLLGALVVWVVGVTAYGVPADAGHVAEATAAVPTVISLVILAVFTILGAAVPGYQTTDPLRAPVLAADMAVEPDEAEPQHALDADGDGQPDYAGKDPR